MSAVYRRFRCVAGNKHWPNYSLPPSFVNQPSLSSPSQIIIHHARGRGKEACELSNVCWLIMFFFFSIALTVTSSYDFLWWLETILAWRETLLFNLESKIWNCNAFPLRCKKFCITLALEVLAHQNENEDNHAVPTKYTVYAMSELFYIVIYLTTINTGLITFFENLTWTLPLNSWFETLTLVENLTK